MNLRKIFLLITLMLGQSAMAIEEPAFKIVLKSDTFEVRQYAPILIAETLVEGDMDEASNKGFRRIADYIFGNNRAAQSGSSAKIAMTAPVTVEPQSEKIAMTAPVTLSAATNEMRDTKLWRVHFVMPSQYTMSTIPQPNNPEVKLKEVPGKLMAVHRYTGFNTLAKVQSKTDELLTWLQQNNFKAIGTTQLSRYDPPWTLPMFRRNEIMVEVEK
ncbi:MAG: hypothetical protein RL462_1539 [Pseudomonadota bacterium]|jgi:hypothetical protein